MLRCETCGRENPEQNRFCGQCGGALSSPQPPTVREEPRTISGPSFLGLGEPEPYRYQDEEDEVVERSSWRGWVVLAVLLVVGGLLWMQWRYATTLRSEPQEKDARPSAVQSEPAAQPTAPPDHAAPPDPPTEPDKAADAQDDAPAAAPKPESDETRPEPESPPEGEPAEEPAAAESEEKLADQLEQERIAQSSGESESARAPAPENDADLALARRALAAGDTAEGVRRLWASTSKGSSVAPVMLAEMYLTGNGVERSCEQALVLLNSAARRQNALARAQLGQMYANGQCAQQDRVAAYHWYTLALNAAPENSAIRQRREQLWDSMTEMEREEARALR